MEERHFAALDNAFASFNDLETLSSPPSHPLKFADAEMYHARRIMQGTVYDRAEDLVFDVENIGICCFGLVYLVCSYFFNYFV